MGLAISITAEPIFSIGGFVVTNSFFTSLIVTTALIIFALIFSRKKLSDVPGGKSLQNFLEIIVETFANFYESVAGKKRTRMWFAFLTTLFLFILFNSWVELLPGVGSIGVWQVHHGEDVLVPVFRAATADLNTTFALAIVGMIFVQYQGIKSLGFSYFKRYFMFHNPIMTFVGFLELLGEFTKVISFSFRLFGNIFAGEVLLAVMSFLIPVIAALPFMGLELFVGVIQSLVFTMLILVFTTGAVHATEH